MYDDFIKEVKIEDKSELEKESELIDNIRFVKNSLNNMYKNLEFAEGDLVDYFTYQIKAEEAKYDYLIKKAKYKNLTFEPYM